MKIIDRRLRELVSINRMQFGFLKGRGTMDAIFTLRQIQEKSPSGSVGSASDS